MNNRFYACSEGANTIATSIDGINWTSEGNSLFNVSAHKVEYHNKIGNVYIQHPTLALGEGIHTIAYSYDGISWRGLGNTVFTTARKDALWSGNKWIAVGSGTNTLAYSKDGFNWKGLGNSVFQLQEMV